MICFMNKILPFLSLTFLLIGNSMQILFAQQITVSGVLMDTETNEPLGFATIGIIGESYGTITNNLGEFDFHIRGPVNDKILAASMLGYESFEKPLSEIDHALPITIRVKKIPQLLEEVIIEDSLTGAEIIEIAINRLPINNADQPYLLDGFYRDIKSVNNTYISLLEAAVQVFDNNHEEPRNPFKIREKVGLLQIRKSLGYNHKYVEYFDQGNLLEMLLLNNTIRYYDFPETSYFKAFKRLGKSAYNNEEVFVVEIRFKGIEMKVYVDMDSYAFIRLDYESDYDENILNVNERYKDYSNRYVKISKTIEYREYQGKYYLHYMKLYKRNQWYHNESKTLDYDVELYQELLVNDVHPSTDKRIKPIQRMRKYGLQYQDQPYDPAFWETYNVIKRTPIDDKIIEDLEREGNLEQQFEGY